MFLCLKNYSIFGRSATRQRDPPTSGQWKSSTTSWPMAGHPSGQTSPSTADEMITRRLKETLSLLEVRVLDYLIIGEGREYSFAESGLL